MGGSSSKPEQPPAGFPRFKGKVFVRGAGTDGEYLAHAYQYATTSLPGGTLAPSAIVYVEDDDDIRAAIAYARAHDIAVAVRTGGHQYGGSSSTNGVNIQIDLSGKEASDPANYPYYTWEYDREKCEVRAGVGLSLKKVSENCVRDGVFFPHGACSHVHLGGHVQTGGYGVLARQFGLFCDRIMSVEMITADGQKRIVRRDATDEAEKELFFAVIGGSPGNLGVITHATIRVSRDADHPNSRGLMLAYAYEPERAKALLDFVSAHIDGDDDVPMDYSLTLIVFDAPPFLNIGGTDAQMKLQYPHLYGPTFTNPPVPVVALAACWANLGGKDQAYDPAYFKRMQDVANSIPLIVPGVFGFYDDKPLPMSWMLQQWSMPTVREYDLPFVKRCYLSTRDDLTHRGFSQWLVDRIEEVHRPVNGCKIVMQVMGFGGETSGFHTGNRDGRTSVSFRDSNLWLCVDAFYDPAFAYIGHDPKTTAEVWAMNMDASACGPDGILGDTHRKLIWSPNGETNLDLCRRQFFDSEATYQRVLAVKRRVDPHDIFTPNRFCVGASHDKVQCK